MNCTEKANKILTSHKQRLKSRECPGCRSYISNVCSMLPLYVDNDIEIKCPCLTCLVKSICITGSECDEVKTYASNIFRWLGYRK